MRKTKWIEGGNRPKQKGVYQRKFHLGNFFSRWNGREWFCGCSDIMGAYNMPTRSPRQYLPWRGLEKESA